MMVQYRHLLPGERVLWEGRPTTGLLLRPSEVFLIPFSLLWGGFALFWNVSAWSIKGGADFKVFGLPFLIAGLYITVGRFVVDMWIRRGIRYAVTDRRILILRRGGRSTKSLDIKRLPALDLDERQDGSGTIRFGSAASWFADNNFGVWQPTFDPTPQFLRVERARTVYELIDRQAR